MIASFERNRANLSNFAIAKLQLNIHLLSRAVLIHSASRVES